CHTRLVELVFAAFLFSPEPATTDIYTLSLHDALPISNATGARCCAWPGAVPPPWSAGPWSRPDSGATAKCSSSSFRFRSGTRTRSEEHTSELQSRENLVCRLLLEKKNKNSSITGNTK